MSDCSILISSAVELDEAGCVAWHSHAWTFAGSRLFAMYCWPMYLNFIPGQMTFEAIKRHSATMLIQLFIIFVIASVADIIFVNSIVAIAALSNPICVVRSSDGCFLRVRTRVEVRRCRVASVSSSCVFLYVSHIAA